MKQRLKESGGGGGVRRSHSVSPRCSHACRTGTDLATDPPKSPLCMKLLLKVDARKPRRLIWLFVCFSASRRPKKEKQIEVIWSSLPSFTSTLGSLRLNCERLKRWISQGPVSTHLGERIKVLLNGTRRDMRHCKQHPRLHLHYTVQMTQFCATNSSPVALKGSVKWLQQKNGEKKNKKLDPVGSGRSLQINLDAIRMCPAVGPAVRTHWLDASWSHCHCKLTDDTF